MNSDFHRQALTKKQRAIYDKLLEWFTSGITADADEREIDVGGPIDINDALEATTAVVCDHPDMVCIRHTKGWSGAHMYTRTDEEGKHYIRYHDTGRDLSHAYTAEERARIIEEVDAWEKDIVSQVKGDDDYSRIVSLLGLFCERFTYSNSASAHDIAGVLSGFVVCESIAMAFKAICDILGIWCIIVIGQAKSSGSDWQGHSWNIVRLGEKHYIVDPTWCITNSHPDPSGMLGKGRFLESDSYICMCDRDVSDTHRTSDDEGDPDRPDEYEEYYRRHGWTSKILNKASNFGRRSRPKLPKRKYPQCDDCSMEYYRKQGWIVRFNEDFSECLTSEEEIKSMIARTEGRYGTVYILRCRFLNGSDEVPPTDTVETISYRLIYGRAGYDHKGAHAYFYDEVTGNYMLIFDIRKTVERKTSNGTIDSV